MRSLVIGVAVVLAFVSAVTSGITTSGDGPGEAAGHQIGKSFSMTQEHMLDWFCGGGESGGAASAADLAKCLASTPSMPFPEMREGMLLRVMQSIYDVLNDKETFPFLPSPLNLVRRPGQRRPTSIKEGRDLLAPIHKLHAPIPNATDVNGKVKYPYFNFLPVLDATLTPGGPNVTYKTKCFTKAIANAVYLNQTHLRVQLTTSGHSFPWLCEESIAIMGGSFALGTISKNGLTTFDLDLSDIMSDPAKMWLVNNRGILMTRFTNALGFLGAGLDLISTVTMFLGFAELPISKDTFDANTAFVRNYVEYNTSRMGAKLRIRESGALVARKIDPDYIQSGDIFIIIRPDGLDPMIAWALGGSGGHTTMAMRSPNGTLHVCETTAVGTYWPKNGIQCHTWAEWWPLADKAQFNVVLLPMNATTKANFDVAKAWDFFYTNQGFDYGYEVLLSGWLDMKEGDQNSPCVPPDFTKCLNRPLMERVLVLIDDFMGNGKQNLVRQMFTHRIGVWPQEYTLPESIQYGQEKLNYTTLSDLYSVVEQDDWLYNTTRYGKAETGPSMVCNVFVCNMLKAGGVFDSLGKDMQCGESNIWTLYSAQLWDEGKMGANRPQICKTADPSNPLCQLMGNWTMHLHTDLNAKPIHANMSNHCPTEGPNYYHTGC